VLVFPTTQEKPMGDLREELRLTRCAVRMLAKGYTLTAEYYLDLAAEVAEAVPVAAVPDGGPNDE